MPIDRKRKRVYIPLLSSWAMGGCAAGALPDDDPEIAVVESKLNSEISGLADIAARIRMGSPDRLLASYATLGRGGNCSGTMIGPNMMLTAAHCQSPATTTANFYYYRDPNPQGIGYFQEVFTCDRLVNTFPETDIHLWWCNANANGESPGDKWGYLDFDVVYNDSNTVNYTASRNRAVVGASVYSIWWNPIVNLSRTQHMIYGAGAIDFTNTSVWSNPTNATSAADMGQCSASDDLQLGFRSNIYSNPGCSGSAMISNTVGPAGRRILGGPISTSATEARDRTGQAIIEMLTRAVIQTPDAIACNGDANQGTMINGTFLSNRGLTAANFRGGIDANNNGVFDVQESVERTESEHRRQAYWLGFDSQRSNLMWSVASAGTIRTNSSAAVLTADSSSWLLHAQHPRLNMLPNSSYHVTFTAASDRQLAVCMDGCAIVGPTPSGVSAYTRYSTVLSSGANGTINLFTSGTGTSYVGEIAVTQIGSVADFDSMDARSLWTSPVPRFTGTNTPTIVPLGRRSHDPNSVGDMAGVVSRGLYTLSSPHLPLAAGNVRVCFDARSNPLDPSAVGAASMRVLDVTTQRTSMAFTIPNDWSRICSSWFSMSSPAGQVDFGLEQAGATGTAGSWLVDNIAFDTDAQPSMRFSYDGPIDGMICRQILEASDPGGTWSDNYLCSDHDIGLAWSSAGPIAGMRCSAITEASEPPSTTWNDNFLCVPTSSPVNFSWGSAGPHANKTCVKWWEPADPHTWNDNFLCY